MNRSVKALTVLAATAVLAGCGADSDNNASAIKRPQQSHSSSPSPTETSPAAVATNLPAGFIEGPVWSDPRELLGKTSDIVVVTNDPEGVMVSDDQQPTEVAGLELETGEEVWSVSTTAPEDLADASYEGAYFLGKTVALAWQGTATGSSLEATDDVVKYAFYEAETGEEVAVRTVENATRGEVLGLNGLEVSGETVFSSDAAEHAIDRSDYAAPAPVAVYGEGVVSGPVDSQFTTLSKDHAPHIPGRFEREVDTGVRDDRIIRHLVAEQGAQNYRHYYEVFDTETMEPVAPAVACEGVSGEGEVAVSPNGEIVAVDQVVANLETGDVNCLADLSDSLEVRATTLADDGSLYGIAGNDRPFSLLASAGAKPEALEADTNVPLAMFDEYALFAADEDGVTVYKRP